MDFVASIKDTLNKTKQSAVKKSNELVEVTRVTFYISGINNEIEQLYREIGQAVFNAFDNKSDLSDIIAVKCEEIKEKRHLIEELTYKLNELKNKKICKECGKANPFSVRYCSECGTKYDDECCQSASDDEQ